MKISEILKGIAAAIEQQEHDVESTPVDKNTNEPSLDDMGKFLPPLQGKHELLKKVSNVESEYDTDEPSDLQDILKLAGVLHTDDDVVG